MNRFRTTDDNSIDDVLLTDEQVEALRRLRRNVDRDARRPRFDWPHDDKYYLHRWLKARPACRAVSYWRDHTNPEFVMFRMERDGFRIEECVTLHQLRTWKFGWRDHVAALLMRLRRELRQRQEWA